MSIAQPPWCRLLMNAFALCASSPHTSGFFLGLLMLAGAVIPVSAATISGTVDYSAYSGGQTGMIVVTASSSPTGAPALATTQLASPGAFTLTNLPAPASYWLFAYRDSNANGTNGSPEARTFSTNELAITGDLSGVALTLLDPDSDGDGMPDWWEMKYGLDPFRNDGLGSGRDGDLTVAAGQTNYSDAIRTTLLFSPAFGTTELPVTGTNGFSSNDLVLIIASQDANTNALQNVAGVFEFKRVTSLGQNRLFVTSSLNPRLRTASQAKIQVLRVPEYRTVTVNGSLTCTAWDGTNGGIVAFLCQGGVVLGSNGRIGADAKGYRGGSASSDYRFNGLAGEGTRGPGFYGNPTRIENQEGGGGVSAIGLDAAGAGGGGYRTAGLDGHDDTQSAYQGKGAMPYGTNTLERLLLGGGGGGCIYPGGSGGGIVFIVAQAVQGSGTIASAGGRGQRNAGVGFGFNSAASGSGAGGSVYVAGMLATTLQVDVQGGQGAQVPNTSTGQGGDGRVRFDLPLGQLPPTSSPPSAFLGQANVTGALYVFTLDSDQDGLSDYQEFLAGANPRVQDSDGDGLPDGWEVQYGLSPNNAADAINTPPGDRLSYLQKFLSNLDPAKNDSDGDGIPDYEEIFVHGTNPLSPDTDGDGLPDGWEVLYGLNPRLNDANESKSFDGVTNLQKYQWNLAHTNAWEQMFPNRAFSGTNTVSDYERFTRIRTSRPIYDRNDRLIGVEYSSGVSLAYVYDGNGNLIRQKWLSRASETNGLPALFSFLNGLTNSIGNGPYDDLDGDGWTNIQEQQAGTNPNDPLSKPDTAFNPGTNIASLQLPFTPTNVVMAVGQLDGLGAEEIVIGADGNPGINTNFILILTQSYNGWTTQRVDVGSFGVTSIAIGQPTNRPTAAIYLGLRQTGGTGRILELIQTNGVWQTNVAAASTSEAAFALGVRATSDVLASLANSGSDGALYSLAFTTNGNVWNLSVLSTNVSRESIGTHGTIASRLPRDTSMRILSTGALELVGGDFEVTVGTNLITLPSGSTNYGNKWYFQTPNPMTWASAEAFCTNVFGHLVTIQSVEENSWLTNRYGGRNFWMGWFLDNYGVNGTFGWASGASWDQGFMNQGRLRYGLNILYPRWGGFVYTDGWWGLSAQTAIYSPYSPEQFYGVGEIANSQMWTNRWLIPTPVGSSLELRGLTIASGPIEMNTQGVNSVFRLMIEDVNGSGVIDSADSLVLAGYSIQTNSWTTNTFIKVPITNTPVSQSVGVAVAKYLVSQPAILFTGEPNGQMFSWKASDTDGALQRKLFSSAHQGKAWHALAGVKLAEPGEALVGLRVDPNNPSACTVIFWPPQPVFETPQVVPQTAPSVALQPSPNAVASLAQVFFRLWDNEGNASLPMLEFQSPGSTVWSNATVLSVDDQMVGRVTALPTGSEHVLLWNAGRDLGAGFTNSVLLRARASDVTLTGNYSATASYRVEVSAGNPVANPDSTNTLQEVPVDIHVLSNDTVQNGRTLSIAAYTQPANGTVGLNANQTLRYTPRTNFLGSDSFNYTISDGTGGTNIAVVTVNVLAVNHPPTPQSYAFTTAEDSPVSFAWNNDRDVDGDLVTLLSVRSPSTAGGLVTLSGGVITYAPPPNFFGTDTFTFIVQDNGLTSGLPDPKQATNTVTITVTPVNDSPVITAATNLLLLNEDVGLLFTGLSVSDPDAANSVLLANLSVTNGILTLGTTNGIAFPAGGTNGTSNLVLQATLADLNAALTNLLYQGVTNFNGSDRLLITLDDQGNTGAGGPLRTTNVVWLTVNPVNDLPTAAITNLTNGQGFLTKDNILIQAEVRDLDGQIIRVDFLAGTNVIGSLTNAPYAVTFTNPPAATNLTLTVRATDDQGGVGVSPGVNITVRLPGLILLSPPVVSASRNVQLLLNNPDIGRQFRLEYSTDLKVWTAIGVASNTNGTLEFNHTVPTNETSRFYRAVLLTQ